MKKRYINLSIFRIIATLAIIQFHIFYIVYPFSIPKAYVLSKFLQGFMVLSGFLYSQKGITDIKGFYTKNLKKILIPALSCLLFMLIWDVGYILITKNYNFYDVFTGYTASSGNFLIQPGNYYFIAYLIGCYLVTPLLQKKGKIRNIFVASVIFVELLMIFLFRGVSILASCYFVGYFIGKHRFDEYVNHEKDFRPDRLLIWVFIAVLAYFGVQGLYEYFPGDSFFITHLHLFTHNFSSTVYGVGMFFIIIYLLRPLNKYDNCALLKFTDSSLIYVYLMNQAFMVGAMDTTIYADSLFVKTVIVYVLTIGSGLFIYLVNKRIFKYKVG